MRKQKKLSTKRLSQEIEPVAYANRARLDGVVARDYRKQGYVNRAIIWEEMAKQTATIAETAQKRVDGQVTIIDNTVIY